MNTFHFFSLKRSLPEGEGNNPSLPSRGTLGDLHSAETKLFYAQMKTAGLEQDLRGNISCSYPHNNPKLEFPQKTAASTFIKMVMNSTTQSLLALGLSPKYYCLHTANLNRIYIKVKKREWGSWFPEFSATKSWNGKKKAFHKYELRHLRQSKATCVGAQKTTGPREIIALLDESIHHFLFGDLSHNWSFCFWTKWGGELKSHRVDSNN